MLAVIERIVNFLAADAGESIAENTADNALETLLRSDFGNPPVLFHRNTIYSITKAPYGDYTIKFSKPDNGNVLTLELIYYPGHNPKDYGVRNVQSPGSRYILIKTEADLASHMNSMS